MSILSDSEIQRRMGLGELVSDGLSNRATECSYSFRPGLAFRAGNTGQPVDFLASPAPDVIVNPGEMIWIRTRESVKIPHDIAGFWWQTNSLSRKGLMLVNMSMVEPGYEGDLACLFVNFGKSKIVISARTTIAKMVFETIQGQVAHPMTFHLARSEYDDALRALAVEQPTSFLQVGELSTDLREARSEALNAIKAAGAGVRSQADADLKQARSDAMAEFKKDIPGTLKQSFGYALGLFAILTLVSFASDWWRGNLFPDVKQIARSEAENVLREQVTISGTPDSQEKQLLQSRIDELSKRLDALAKKP